uniref:Ig-like domain-containing protein n=1 Tax=Parascaris univalens TaxID=6257 RepID=A0A915B7X6_PARUN
MPVQEGHCLNSPASTDGNIFLSVNISNLVKAFQFSHFSSSAPYRGRYSFASQYRRNYLQVRRFGSSSSVSNSGSSLLAPLRFAIISLSFSIPLSSFKKLCDRS